MDELSQKTVDRAALLARLNADFGPLSPGKNPNPRPMPSSNKALVRRLLAICPCLITQMEPSENMPVTTRAVVHLCELALGQPITSANVHSAFIIQHPSKTPDFKYQPLKACTDGGGIMEMLCSEVLANEGIPPMLPDEATGWTVWNMPGHILLNEGRMQAHRAFGDIMLPCAPTNLVISVKSEKARERLLYSSNAIEGVGFGFFDQPDEFWSESRMNLYKRMGFTAIYMPSVTLDAITAKVVADGTERLAVNINGTALYRDLKDFGADMHRVVGRSSLNGAVSLTLTCLH